MKKIISIIIVLTMICSHLVGIALESKVTGSEDVVLENEAGFDILNETIDMAMLGTAEMSETEVNERSYLNPSGPNSTNKKVTYDFDEYNWSDPSHFTNPMPLFLTDEQFFGKWNNVSGQYNIEGKLDYNFINTVLGLNFNLKDVEEAVKAGDYDTAKEKLLEYYRNVYNRRGAGAPPSSRRQNLLARLALQCYHVSTSEGPQITDIIELGKTPSWVEADAIEHINANRDKVVTYVFEAINKDDYQARFFTKENGKIAGVDKGPYTPYLEVVAGGATIKIQASHDAYVGAMANANNTYGSEEFMYAEEHFNPLYGYPHTDDTKKAYVSFDLSVIPSGAPIHSAKLRVFGNWVDTAEEARNNPSYKKSVVVLFRTSEWNENTITFSSTNFRHGTFSYDGQYSLDWVRPYGATQGWWVGRINQEMYRFSGWWDQIINEYRLTGDEDYARTAMLFLHNLIVETFAAKPNLPAGPHPRSEPGKPYIMKDFTLEATNTRTDHHFTNGVYGFYPDTLDASQRTSAVTTNLMHLYNSEYMTPELFTTYLKWIWHTGHYLARNWSSSEDLGNWGDIQNSGTLRLIAIYPEFKDVREVTTFNGTGNSSGWWWVQTSPHTGSWMDIWWKKFNRNGGSVTHEDGSSKEYCISYTNVIFDRIYAQKSTADTYELPFDLPAELHQSFTNLAKYMIHTTLPGVHDIQSGNAGSDYTHSYMPRVIQFADWLQDPFLLWIGYNGRKGEAPNYTSYAYRGRGKKLAMRSDWGKDARFLHVNADAANGVHAHWDDLGIIVSAYGEYLLSDPRDYIRSDNSMRRWLVSSKGHNTVEINDVCQGSVNPSNYDSVLPKSGGGGEFTRLELNDSYDFVKIDAEGTYKNIYYQNKQTPTEPWLNTGPGGVEPGGDVHRNILFVRPNFWIVSDHMDPVNKNVVNKFTQMWHTKPKGDFIMDGQYVLQPGDEPIPWTIESEPERIARLSQDIPRTHFVPGTGTGAFITTNNGAANMMVVPTNLNEVTPKLKYGTYHHGGDLPYGVFEQNVQGATKMDTILFPTKQGQTYSIVPTPITLEEGLPKASVSAFTADFSDTSSISNEEFRVNYHIVHEPNQVKERLYGNYKTNGHLSYLETKMSGLPRRLILQDATHMSDAKRNFAIFYSLDPIDEISVEWVGNDIYVYNSDEANPIDFTKVSIYAAHPDSRIIYNGTPVTAYWNNNYISGSSTPLLDGSGIVLYEPLPGENVNPGPPSSPSHGKPTGSGSSGSVSNGVGGNAVVGENGAGNGDVTSARPSESFEAELEGHWGREEISLMIDKGIIKGSNGSLSLTTNVTKAEFATMILRATGIEPVSYRGVFTDITGNEWYADYLQAAFDEGIIEGFEGKAEAENILNREQAMKMLVTTNNKEIDIFKLSEFEDADDVSHWARGYVAAAVEFGFIIGDTGRLFPLQNVPREQAIVMVYRMYASEYRARQ